MIKLAVSTFVNMIYVTKPFIPPLEEYREYLDQIWDREYLTNDGPLVRELEKRLNNYLQTKHLSYVSNGTIALQIAIKALELKGEIITTPFSYVATTSSIVWEQCTPVFADIDPNSFNIDPLKIEEAITSNTSAIIATHVFGNPCDIDAIQKIATKYDLAVIYDASHCFGTNYKGSSIFRYGDVSTTSFHATKLFHTVEGGALFTENGLLNQKINYMRNFGHDGPGRFNGVGINGKNSEIHAAMGLCVLNHIDEILARRKSQSEYYAENLSGCQIQFQSLSTEVSNFNYAYFPVIFESEAITLTILNALEEKEIFSRRYFFPSLTELNYVSGSCPISDQISTKILCLPLYHTLKKEEQDLVIETIRGCLL